MLSDRLFQVHLNGEISPFRNLQNGLPQGSVLAPLFFNIYVSDLPHTKSQKFMYADDMAIATQNKNTEPAEETLISDLESIHSYFDQWGLQLNAAKTEVSAFHLDNHLANHELEVTLQGSRLKHNHTPKYLGVTLDRTLTFKHHLQKVSAKIKTRNNIIEKLAGSSWGASADVLRTSALALVYSAAEYCSPVWLNSKHAGLVDTVLNQTMRTITGTIKPTPIQWLPVLSNIAPPHLRRLAALKSQCETLSKDAQLPIHSNAEPLITQKPRLRSRNPPLRMAHEKLNDFSLKDEWPREWTNNNISNKNLIQDPSEKPEGFDLPRRQWCNLNRIRTGHGVCNKSLYQWGYSDSPQCNFCHAEEQSITHIIQDCPPKRFDGTLDDLHKLEDDARLWLRNSNLQL
nr:unnamed protein product [Callosobruchus chinensis]